MAKKKTNKAAAKRFKITGNGKVKYKKAGTGHLLTCKSRKRKRTLRKTGVLSDPESKRIAGLLAS